MKKLMSTLTGMLMLTLPATILADPPRGIVAHTVGTYTVDFSCAGAGCAGDLVTCPVNQGLLSAKITWLFVEGVCDDNSPTPCGGRLRGLLEDCLNPALPGPNLNVGGAILSLATQGKIRMCFDNTAVSDCTGSPPAATIVGEGVNRLQGRQLLGVLAPITHNDEVTLTKTKHFTIDGKETSIRATLATYDGMLQPDLENDNCKHANGGVPGCGFAGTAVSTKSK